MKEIVNSLQFKLFLCVLLIMVPLIAALIINYFYSTEVIRNQVAQSNKNMLNIYMNQLDSDLEGVETYIYSLLDKNVDLYYLQENDTMEMNDYQEAKLRLYNAINNQSNFYTIIDSIFIYSTAQDDIINTQKFSDSYLERVSATEEIRQLLANQPENFTEGQWFIWEGKDNYYLLQYFKIDGVYVGAWINMDNIIMPFKYIDFVETGRAVITTLDHKPITNGEFIKQEKIDLNLKGKTYAISGEYERFVVMQERSSRADFYLIALVPEDAILDKLPYLQKISIMITMGAILFLFIFIFIMRKVFFQPINQIVSAMKKLRQGDMDVRLPIQSNSSEFEVMNTSFNHMTSEIKDLKIHVYEEKLNLQRAELKHLQLQINPHFFLNSLNIIYNLATVKEYAIIQEMSKCLANYFRFMFRSNSYFVRLQDEMQHTDNYLRIQQLRFPDTFRYQIELPSDLKEFSIPPLVVQTLAENAIKYALNLDESLEIHIVVKSVENNFIQITIQDTGEGFPLEILNILENGGTLVTNEGERMGIWNVMRRLKILYEGSASISFSNEASRGAKVTINIPKTIKSKKGVLE